MIVANTNGDGLSHTDSVGGTRTYTYNCDGELTSYRDADGSGCDSVRDDAGRILSKKDTKGNVQTYTYDERGNLLSHRSSDGTSGTWSYNAQRLFQVLCKLKKSDIRYVNSYVRAEPFFDGSALICIMGHQSF